METYSSNQGGPTPQSSDPGESHQKQCPFCGYKMDHTAAYCPHCGAAMSAPNYGASPTGSPYTPKPASRDSGGGSVFGILAVVFGALGGFLGLVFGIIGLCTDKARSTKVLCWIGIGLFLFWVVVAIIFYSWVMSNLPTYEMPF